MQGVGTIPKGFRFPAALRLKKTREFNDVYRRGRRARGRLFLVVFLRNELPYSRIGLSVGKRIGGAVRRNKVKRMLRDVSPMPRWSSSMRSPASKCRPRRRGPRRRS
jgi:hypothetical protein